MSVWREKRRSGGSLTAGDRRLRAWTWPKLTPPSQGRLASTVRPRLSRILPQPPSCERTAASSHRPLWVKLTVVLPSVSSKSISISVRRVSPSQIQVKARRVGRSISV